MSSSVPVFAAGPYVAVACGPEDAPRLQRLYDANPEYFLRVSGVPASATEALEDLTELPPADLRFARNWCLGFEDAEGRLVGYAGVIEGLLAPTVWHIGLLLLATELHGRGQGRQIHDGLEAWARAGGAQWLRLGVVEGNRKAERFWERMGYVEVRTRDGVVIGRQINRLSVRVKALGPADLLDYLALVPRDDASRDGSAGV